MITGIKSVAVLVTDAKRAAEWYREKLGFEVSIQGHWVTVNPKGTEMKLHLCEKCKEWEASLAYPSRWTTKNKPIAN